MTHIWVVRRQTVKDSPPFTYSSVAQPIAVESAIVAMEKILLLLDGEPLR